MRDLILRLGRARARLLRRLAGPGERGAIGVLVAVLIAGGALFGIGALVIDTGQLYQNRAELQNGADAGALAVAKSCANGTCTPAVAAQYASANASALTGRTAAALVCGSGSLGPCTAGTGQIYDCPATPAAGTNYVDVHTSTRLADGSTLLPPVFSRTLAGNGSYQGSTVLACARAGWGPALQSTSSLAMTLSYCAWSQLTGNGTAFGTTGVIFIKGSAKPCSGPAGQNVPGGFGWLDPSPAGSCQANIDLTTSTSGNDPGNNVTTPCKTALQQDVANATTVYLPVFTATGGSGQGASYTLVGLAAFVLTGYQNIPGLHPDVVPSGMNGQCTGNAPCIFGRFTQALVPVTDVIGTGTNFGAVAIKLTG